MKVELNKTISLSLLLAVSPVIAFSQNLNKEITIDREIVPEHRAVTRLNTNANILTPTFSSPRLSISERDLAVGLVPRFSSLNPSATLPAIELSDYKGYISGGYFPAANLGASAGYRLIGTKQTTIDSYLQFTNNNFKGTLDKETRNDLTVDAGANIFHAFNNFQNLSANFNIGYLGLKTPSLSNFFNLSYPGYEPYNLTSSAFNLGADGKWFSGTNNEFYTVGVHAGIFSFGAGKDWSRQLPADMKAVSQTTFGLNFGLRYNFFAIDVNADFASTGKINQFADNVAFLNEANKTTGIIGASPRFVYESDRVKAEAGVSLQYAVNGEKKFRVAPDVKLDFQLTSYVAAYARINGGEQLNTLRDVVGWFRNACPFQTYGLTYTPIRANAGVVIGASTGFSLEVFGGYSKSKNELFPIIAENNLRGVVSTEMKGFHFGGRINYSFGKVVEFSGSATYASNGLNKGYALWKDHARQAYSAEIKVRPIQKLAIETGFELRTKRSCYFASFVQEEFANPSLRTFDIENRANLWVGGSWKYNSQLSFFARGENLLNKKWWDLGLTGGRGITGLIGCEYRF